MINLSVIIPSHKDPCLQKTIDSLLENAGGEIEIIPVLDGYWPDTPVKNEERIRLVHLGKNRGMREAINAGVGVSRGKYIMRTDERCQFGKDFDRILTEDIKDNRIITPRRYFLDPVKWEVMDTPPVDDEKLNQTLSMQGNCWVMHRSWWDKVIKKLQAKGSGPLNQDLHEIVLKTRKAGGKLTINKKTWCAFPRTSPKEHPRQTPKKDLDKVSVIIPSRNEEYLNNTINSLLTNAEGEIEIVVVLEGKPFDQPPKDPRVRYIRNKTPKGMRKAINKAAKAVTGKYLMKCDAHCAFDQGYDTKLKKDCEPDWTVVPRRYSIDKNRWTKHGPYYDFQYISHPKDPNYQFKGVDWPEYGARVKGEKIVDLMTSQGSCWFMYRKRFEEIDGIDEKNYGTMGAEAQEVCLKSWLSGGRYVLNRKTWYAHKKKRVGKKKNDRGYRKPMREWKKSRKYAIECWTNNQWPKQKKELKWLIDKFRPIPGWHTKWPSVKTNHFIRQRYKLNYGCEDYPRVIEGLNRDGLVDLWKELGYKIGAEVGVARGAFSSLMYEGIPGLKMYLVDQYSDYDGMKKVGVRQHKTYEKIAHKKLDKYGPVWMREISETASAKIPDNSLDFVYIDGNHRYDWVMLDIILWRRKIRRGGMIAGHDYNTKRGSYKRDVRLAVDDYTRQHGILPYYITDNAAVKYRPDRHASWFWIR